MANILHRDLVVVRAVERWKGHLSPIGQSEQSQQSLDHKLNPPAVKADGFPYRPLDRSKNEIRLLRVSQPAEVDGTASLSIEHVSLDSDLVFDALSYTWADAQGDSTPREPLLLNDVFVAITHNLNLAIRRVFLRGQPGTLFWVDALCINQKNVEEKNSQVRKMKDVYQKAQRVVAWLGDEYPNSTLAFTTLCEIVNKGVKDSVYKGNWDHDQELEACAREKARSLIALFCRPWWARMWIVQEAALAKTLILHCGANTIPWEIVKSAVEKMVAERNFLLDTFIHGDIAPYVMILSVQETESYLFSFGTVDKTTRQAPLGSLLVKNRYKLCSDARDKVYGVLGLTLTSMQNKINVTYGKCTMRVYLDATVAVLEEEGDFNVVLENKRPRAFDRKAELNYGLPTWVCNYHNMHGNENFGLISQFSYAWAGAGGKESPVFKVNRRSDVPPCFLNENECRCEMGSTMNDDTLQVRGVAVGQIKAVGPVMPENATFDFHFPTVINTLYEWWLMYLSAGGKNILKNKSSFVNIIKCGDYYQKAFETEHNYLTSLGASTHELGKEFLASLRPYKDLITQRQKELDEAENKIRYCLNIVMGVHKPHDTTLRPLLGDPVTPSGPEETNQAQGNIWLATMTTTNRRFMTVPAGDREYCGLAPMCAEVGDIIVVVLGSKVPIVLRERAPSIGGGYLNIGDAYLYDFMDGEALEALEALEDSEDLKLVEEDFVIH